jgi:hypothetical protein
MRTIALVVLATAAVRAEPASIYYPVSGGGAIIVNLPDDAKGTLAALVGADHRGQVACFTAKEKLGLVGCYAAITRDGSITAPVPDPQRAIHGEPQLRHLMPPIESTVTLEPAGREVDVVFRGQTAAALGLWVNCGAAYTGMLRCVRKDGTAGNLNWEVHVRIGQGGQIAFDADAAVTAAREAAERARKMAEEATARLQEVVAQLDALNERIASAQQAINAAQSQAERDAANARLRALQKEQAEMRQKIAEAKAAAAKAEREKGVHVSPECMQNPLAKGCS